MKREEIHRQFGKDVLKFSDEELEKYVQDKVFHERNLRDGHHAINVYYHALDEKLLEALRTELSGHGIELGFYDRRHAISASFENELISYMVPSALIGMMFQNAVWDILKLSILKFREIAMNALVKQINSQGIVSELPNGVSFNFNVGSIRAHFVIPKEVKHHTAEHSLREVPLIIKGIPSIELGRPEIVYFVLTKKGTWRVMSLTEYIDLNIKKNKKKFKLRKVRVGSFYKGDLGWTLLI